MALTVPTAHRRPAQPFELSLRGKIFLAGASMQSRQFEEYENRMQYVGAPEYFGADGDEWPLLFRMASFVRGSGEGGRPLLEYIPPPVDGKLIRKGSKCAPKGPMSIKGLRSWLAANRSLEHINTLFEVIPGPKPDDGVLLDWPSKVGFDIDVKDAQYFHKLPTIEARYVEKELLDFVAPRLIQFLSDLFSLRGAVIDPPLTKRDMRVSSSCEPYREERLAHYREKGRTLSFHVAVPRLKLRGQDDRDAFTRGLTAKLVDLQGIVDFSVYSANSLMRLLGNRKYNGPTLMPYPGGGEYADDVAYESPEDIPGSVFVEHVWSLVPTHAQSLFTDDTLRLTTTAEREAGQPQASRRRAHPDADDPRVALVLDVAERYARTHPPWTFLRTECNFSVSKVRRGEARRSAPPLRSAHLRSLQDSASYGFEIVLPPPRVCPLLQKHIKHAGKLVLRNGAVHYYCHSAARSSPTLSRLDDDEEAATDHWPFSLLRSAPGGRGRRRCCDIYLGEVAYCLSTVPRDLVREHRLDGRGVPRECAIDEATEKEIRRVLAVKGGPGCDEASIQGWAAVLCAYYGAGKTEVVKELIVRLLHTDPNLTVAYIAPNVSLVDTKCEEITTYAQSHGFPDFEMRHYRDDTEPSAVLSGSYGICSQSAPRFSGLRFDLVVLDEINGILRQVVGLSKPEAVLPALQAIAGQAARLVLADANADEAAASFLRASGRVAAWMDTPSAVTFAGRKVEVMAFSKSTPDRPLAPHMAYAHAVKQAVAAVAVGSPVSIGCAWVVHLRAITGLLRTAGLKVLCVHSGNSDADKAAFLRAYERKAGVPGPGDNIDVFVYSPTVCGGVSNDTCKLQMYFAAPSGPDNEGMRQAMMRARDATLTSIYLMDRGLAYARAPRLVQTGVVAAAEGMECGQLTRPNLQRQVQHIEACRIIAQTIVDTDLETQEALYAKEPAAAAEGRFSRLELRAPLPLATLQDAQDGLICHDASENTLRAASRGNSVGYGDALERARTTTFGVAGTLLDELRASCRLEELRQRDQFLGFLEADCKRGGIHFSIHFVDVSAKDAQAASAEVKASIVDQLTALVVSDIDRFIQCIYQRDLWTKMVSAVADSRAAATAGEREVIADARRRARVALHALPAEMRSEFSFVSEQPPREGDQSGDGGDTYFSSVLALLCEPFAESAGGGDGDEDISGLDDGETADHLASFVSRPEVAALQLKKLWYAVLSFSEPNLAKWLREVREDLCEHRRERTPKSLAAASKQIGFYMRLHSHSVQHYFRAFCMRHELWKGEESAQPPPPGLPPAFAAFGRPPRKGVSADDAYKESERSLIYAMPGQDKQWLRKVRSVAMVDKALVTAGLENGLFADTGARIPRMYATAAAAQKARQRNHLSAAELPGVTARIADLDILYTSPTAQALKFTPHPQQWTTSLSKLFSKLIPPMRISVSAEARKEGAPGVLNKDRLLDVSNLGRWTYGIVHRWDSFAIEVGAARQGGSKGRRDGLQPLLANQTNASRKRRLESFLAQGNEWTGEVDAWLCGEAQKWLRRAGHAYSSRWVLSPYNADIFIVDVPPPGFEEFKFARARVDPDGGNVVDVVLARPLERRSGAGDLQPPTEDDVWSWSAVDS